MASVPLSVAKQAEQLRLDGNTFFKKDRFGAAIDAYTEAITLCPNVPVYRTNRALCYRKRNDWIKVEEDCRKALELDGSSVKAHYMLGLSLLERKDYAEGIKELDKALDLGRGANPVSYMVEEIWQVLAKAKYMEWENESSKRSWRLQNLKEECEKALTEHYLLDSGGADNNSEEAEAAHLERLDYLAEVFNLAGQADKPTEVPDSLCCKITLDIFRDPVITPSGITYERAVLLDHLQRVGRFDPTTREPLEPQQLVPNLAIKEAVQAFLKDHVRMADRLRKEAWVSVVPSSCIISLAWEMSPGCWFVGRIFRREASLDRILPDPTKNIQKVQLGYPVRARLSPSRLDFRRSD